LNPDLKKRNLYRFAPGGIAMSHKALKIKSILLAGVMVVLILGLTACTGGGPGAQTTATSSVAVVNAPPGVAVLHIVTNAKLGKILADGEGITLYIFKLDTPGVSNCLSTCGATWPPLLSKAAPVIGSPEITGKLGVITRPDGSQQATYNDLPLYTFVLDVKPGDTSGNGYGGNWTVATP
jgi:predicted lipoprotein with Yx(FWY)xxD motif